MASTNRAAILTKLLKVVKKRYQPTPPPASRSLLEQLLFACLFENAPQDKAEEAFAALSANFFDWNEVRVTTIKELAEVMHVLPDAEGAAARLRKVLQGVFELTYSFDLEGLHKVSQGKAVEQLSKFGASPFATALIVQTCLSGHAIPVTRGLLEALLLLGAIRESDRDAGAVPGLERAVPKSKGAQTASLLHQFGVEFGSNPYSTSIHAALLEIEPSVKDRLPNKRREAAQAKKAELERQEADRKAAEKAKQKELAARKKAEASKKAPAGKKPRPGGKETESKSASKKRPAVEAKKPAAKKKPTTSRSSPRKPK